MKSGLKKNTATNNKLEYIFIHLSQNKLIFVHLSQNVLKIVFSEATTDKLQRTPPTLVLLFFFFLQIFNF